MFEGTKNWLTDAASSLPSLFPRADEQEDYAAGSPEQGPKARPEGFQRGSAEEKPGFTGSERMGEFESIDRMAGGSETTSLGRESCTEEFEQVNRAHRHSASSKKISVEDNSTPSSETLFTAQMCTDNPAMQSKGINLQPSIPSHTHHDTEQVSGPALALSKAFYEVKAMFSTVQQWSSTLTNTRLLPEVDCSEEPIWLLGCKYQEASPARDKDNAMGSPHPQQSQTLQSWQEVDPVEPSAVEQFLQDWHSRVLITYRKDFEPIGSSHFTSDVGWGCMIRSAQMMLAHTILLHRYGRSWRYKEDGQPSVQDQLSAVVSLFHDSPSPPLSLHHFCSSALLPLSIPPGTWIGPFTACSGLRTLCGGRKVAQALGVPVHVVTDGAKGLTAGVPVLCVEEVEELWREWGGGVGGQGEGGGEDSGLGEKEGGRKGVSGGEGTMADAVESGVEPKEEGGADTPPQPVSSSECPVLLLVPMVLGLETLNPRYLPSLEAVFRLPQCVGALGGKPGSSTFLVGIQGQDVLFLDPHCVQTCAPFQNNQVQDLSSYHPNLVCRMLLRDIDPSLALGFYCNDAASFSELCQRLEELRRESAGAPLLIVSPERPPDPVRDPLGSMSVIELRDEEWEMI